MAGDRVEHRLQVEPGGTDGVEDVGHRGLAFEGGVEVVEQLGVGNGDGGLVGEGLEDRGLLLVERAHLTSGEVHVADPFVVVEQRNRHARADTCNAELAVEVGAQFDRSDVVEEQRQPAPRADAVDGFLSCVLRQPDE